MFDKLLDFLKSIWKDIIPFFVVNEHQMAIIFRFGKYKGTYKPGLHWKIPFAEVPQLAYVKTRTETLSPQTLTTMDGKQIVIRAIVRFSIDNVRKYIIDVWSADNALSDTVHGFISDFVQNNTWETIMSKLLIDITPKTIEAGARWGMEVEKVTFSDFATIRTYRLMNDKP